jgi:hypothetical protein
VERHFGLEALPMETKLSSDLASAVMWLAGGTILLIFVIALIPAIFCRALLSGIVGQVTSTAAFLAVFGALWLRHHWHRGPRQHYNANQKS